MGEEGRAGAWPAALQRTPAAGGAAPADPNWRQRRSGRAPAAAAKAAAAKAATPVATAAAAVAAATVAAAAVAAAAVAAGSGGVVAARSEGWGAG